MRSLQRAATFSAGVAGLALAAGVTVGSSHAEPTASLYGTWTSSDGTSNKVFREDGRCTGFFYNQGSELDIGGPMWCELSSKPRAAGRYQLNVTQQPNEASYLVEFDGADAATVYTLDGQRLYHLERF